MGEKVDTKLVEPAKIHGKEGRIVERFAIDGSWLMADGWVADQDQARLVDDKGRKKVTCALEAEQSSTEVRPD